MKQEDYLSMNRDSWNRRTAYHVSSGFYDVQGFLSGACTLKPIERALLGELRGKSVLHLQCHFGLDTLSLARLGAQVTGMDLSDKAIEEARLLAIKSGLPADFVCCDLYSLPQHLSGQFDMVFTSYGVIGWLPDLDSWAAVISHFLKPGGRFIMAEFHPFVWTFDDQFSHIAYDYFNTGPIREQESGTYADRGAPITTQYTGWNHSLAEVLGALMSKGIQPGVFEEYDYSPYNCFTGMREDEPGKFRIAHLTKKIPMVFALSAVKNKAT